MRRCDAQARRGTGTGRCDGILNERGQCLRASQHLDDDALPRPEGDPTVTATSTAAAAYLAQAPTGRAAERNRLAALVRAAEENLGAASAAMATVLVAEAALYVRRTFPTATTVVFTLEPCDAGAGSGSDRPDTEWVAEVHSILDGTPEMLWARKGRHSFTEWVESYLAQARAYAENWFTPGPADGLWQISVTPPPVAVTLTADDWQLIVAALDVAAEYVTPAAECGQCLEAAGRLEDACAAHAGTVATAGRWRTVGTTLSTILAAQR